MLFIALISLPLLVKGQFNESIRSGRPGQAIGAYSVGKKVFQVQSGLTYNQAQFDSDNQIRSYVVGTVLRAGVTEKLEVSGVINWRRDDITSPEEGQILSGIGNTQIGARYNISKNQGAVPAIAIQGRALLTAQSQEYRRDKIGSKFILATGNKVNDWLSIGTNWGVLWSGYGADPQSFYALNFSFGLSDKIGAFAEIYGGLDEFNTYFDGGFSYLINLDLQLDLSAGWQGENNITDWFVDGGISYRLNWRD